LINDINSSYFKASSPDAIVESQKLIEALFSVMKNCPACSEKLKAELKKSNDN
jgi:hypothetical protein